MCQSNPPWCGVTPHLQAKRRNPIKAPTQRSPSIYDVYIAWEQVGSFNPVKLFLIIGQQNRSLLQACRTLRIMNLLNRSITKSDMRTMTTIMMTSCRCYSRFTYSVNHVEPATFEVKCKSHTKSHVQINKNSTFLLLFLAFCGKSSPPLCRGFPSPLHTLSVLLALASETAASPSSVPHPNQCS